MIANPVSIPTNPGFLVRSDRFSLTDPDEYVLDGWLVPGTVLSAKTDGKDFPVNVLPLTDNVDERYGGCAAKAVFHFSENVKDIRKLRVYTSGDAGRRLAFEISGEDLEKKRGEIRYFIDDYTVDRKDGFFRVTGWAVAKDHVTVDAWDTRGRKISGAVERYKRLDTVDLFGEYPVEEDNGFNVEIRPIPDGPVRVRMRAGKAETVLIYPVSEIGYRLKEAEKYWLKGMDALKYSGPAALWTKTYNKLFNPAMREVRYSDWIKKHLPSGRVLALQRQNPVADAPLVSIVVPVFRTPEKYLRAMMDSVIAQTYSNWELVLSDGSGPNSPVAGVLGEYAAKDRRIHVLHHFRQLGISENTNAAIAAARGEWIAFADHDDILVSSALYECMKALQSHPSTDVIYTDEDKIGTGDKLIQPNMKPDFDPDFLDSVNYICHLLLVRRSVLEKVALKTSGNSMAEETALGCAGREADPAESVQDENCTDGKMYLDPAMNGAQDHDLLLRISEKTQNFLHVPKILYHWRFFEGSTAANPESKTWAFEAGRRAVQNHYDRLGWPATAEMGEFPGIYRTTWNWPDHPKVSVIIPNKDHLVDLKKCLTSLDRCVKWPDLEILIVENNSTEEETFAGYKELEKDPRIRVLWYKGSFNYSAINNFGAREAKGEYLLLLNNDTEFISDAVTEMMGFAMRPDVGAVGARLYYGDDTIQHAGAIIGWGGVAGHAFVNQKRGESGYQHRIICQQDYSAVTAACMMVRKDVYDGVGGFTEELAVAFNDIDLCMKIREAGYLIVYNPFAELYHYESKSRGLENTPEKKSRFGKELKYFQKKWPDILRDGDPYYSPNLSMITQDFSLKRI